MLNLLLFLFFCVIFLLRVLVVVGPARSEVSTKTSKGKNGEKKTGDLSKCSADKASTKPSSRLPSAIKLETERNLRTTTVRASNEMWKAITACATVPKGTLSLDHRKLGRFQVLARRCSWFVREITEYDICNLYVSLCRGTWSHSGATMATGRRYAAQLKHSLKVPKLVRPQTRAHC